MIGAVLVNAIKFWLSFAAPDIWPFILAGIIVLVVLVFPNGLLDLAKIRPKWSMPRLKGSERKVARNERLQP